MVEVIKLPTQELVYCRKCSSLLRYKEGEILIYKDKNGKQILAFIPCPSCGEEVRVNGRTS